MKKVLVSLFVMVCVLVFNCKAADDYAPITNIDKEEVWPLVHNAMKLNGLVLESFDYPNNTMASGFYDFKDILLSFKGKFIFKYDNSSLSIDFIDVQYYSTSSKAWVLGTPTFSNKMKKVRMNIVKNIQEMKSNPDTVNQEKEKFYNDLWVTAKYFENATELAGQKWFETYLKGKKVSWDLTFSNASSNNDPEYKYAEYYALANESAMSDSIILGNKFSIMKLVNSDANAFTQKGTKKNVTGYVRALSYMNNSFFILITENPDGEIKSFIAGENKPADKPSITSKADELLKLKELLDKGILTKAEYEAEKKKILESK